MSRELDVRVAREVMKWPESICATVSEGSKPGSPSTDMNAAMEVVEKMRGNGFDFALQGDVTWWAIFTPGEIDYGGTRGDTPALAICLAALEAVKSTE